MKHDSETMKLGKIHLHIREPPALDLIEIVNKH